MIKLAIDVMGGDFAPLEIIKGVDIALKRYPDISLVLYGDEKIIKENLEAKSRVEIINSPDVLSMGEEDPIREIRKNKNSSLVMAFQAVKDNEVGGAVTAGPTQGVVVAAHMIVRRIRGMKRTALAPLLPNLGGKRRYLLDVGANTELRSEHLLQLAQYASIYMRETMGIKNPLVGLMNIGAEEGKGRDLEKEAYVHLNNDPNVNFYGNVEAKEVFSTECDILVTDGFTGNMIMKTSEGVGKAIGVFFKEEIKSTRSKLGYLLLKKVFGRFKRILSADEIGGANLFGIDGIIVKAHGASSAYAFSSAIGQARLAIMGDVVEKMKKIIGEGSKLADE